MRPWTGWTRGLGAATLALALVTASACSDGDPDTTGQRAGALAAGVTPPEQVTTTTEAPEDFSTEIATADVAVLEVFTEIPADDAPGDEGAAAPASATRDAVSASPAAEGENALPPVQPLQPGVGAIPRPSLDSAGVRITATGWAYDNPTYWGNPLTMMVVDEADGWLQVSIPARPNHQVGWVRAEDVTVAETEMRMELQLSTFTLRAFDGDEQVFETQVVTGKEGTPTPVGSFYLVEELPQQSTGGAYGAMILPLSAYSETMDLFDGGLPVIALHGTNNPGLIGTQASNGCVRMSNDAVLQLAELVEPGTPIDIIA